VTDALKDLAELLQKRLPQVPAKLLLGLSLSLGIGAFYLWGYLDLDQQFSAYLLQRLARLLPPTLIALLFACVALFYAYKTPDSADTKVKALERPIYQRLSTDAETLLLLLSNAKEQMTLQKMAKASELTEAKALFHLESMLDKKYAKDLYDNRGRTWSCAKEGRAYLAHHNLI